MEKTSKSIIAFLEKYENATKEQLSEASGLKGLQLFNILKQLQKDERIIESGTKDYKVYTIVKKDQEMSEEPINEREKDEMEETATQQKGRDNSKFKFNGELYGKGPLVRAVVQQYVLDNPTTNYKQLKEVFPDELLKRFGIFQDEKTANEIAPKGSRYFEKPEQMIKLKDRKIMVCNQFTLSNIQPFLKVARSFGYKIK